MVGSAQTIVRGARVLTAGLGIAALAWTAGPAPSAAPPIGTGQIGGTVEVVTRSSQRLATAGAYPSRSVTVAPLAVRSELSNVVVFVRTQASTAPAPMRAVIRQQNEEFLPHLVAITVGSTVEFPNDDLIFHNVFSLSRSATFDLGRFPKGESRERRFTKPGLVKVFCHLHSHMSALVRVFDHAYFDIPDVEGRFAIDGLAPGRYDVVAWHERVGEVAHSVAVVEGASASTSFSLPVTGSR